MQPYVVWLNYTKQSKIRSLSLDRLAVAGVISSEKFKWSILLFIILALVLSTGVSYLALNQNVKKANENTTPK